jgi:hypothetical protein
VSSARSLAPSSATAPISIFENEAAHEAHTGNQQPSEPSKRWSTPDLAAGPVVFTDYGLVASTFSEPPDVLEASAETTAAAGMTTCVMDSCMVTATALRPALVGDRR